MPDDLVRHLPPPDLLPRREPYDRVLDYPRRLNLADEILRHPLESGRADAPAVFHRERALTYRELDQKASRLAGGLRAAGIEPGDRVMLRIPNRPEFVISWFAIQKLGAVAVATMPLLRARELDYVASDSEAAAILVSSDLMEEVERAGLSRLRHVVTGARWEELSSFAPVASVEVERNAPALIAYTSGSTGVPKGCVHFPEDVLASADTYAKDILSPAPGDVYTGHPTLAFTFGLGGLLVFPLRFGATTCLVEGFTPETMLETMTRHRATACFCAPTSFKRMLQVENARARFDLGSLRAPVSAGETLPAATFDSWGETFGTEILDGIGSTEMFHIFISGRRGRARAGATGEVVPGYKAKVVDERGVELPAGEAGLLAVSGPTGCKYWKKPDRQREYVRDGWNYPGDVYQRDADGYFWYQCRGDDMIITSGYNVAGPEVENVLLEHPAVSEVAVVASPDELRGHIVKAFVVASPGVEAGPALAEALQDHVRRELAPYKYPREVEFVTSLPRTETGKVRRVELREREAERKARSQ